MNRIISSKEIESFERNYRVNLINSLSGPKSANLLGTIDSQGLTNLSIVSSCVHLGADPALLGIVFRPHVTPRHTLENIIETKDFTMNQVHHDIVNQAHQTSARYPKEISEFKACNLTEEYMAEVKAPFVRESFLKLHLTLEEIIPIKQNGTEFLIAKIQQIIVPEQAILADGFIDLESLQSSALIGLDAYYSLKKIRRLSYAKPDKALSEI